MRTQRFRIFLRSMSKGRSPLTLLQNHNVLLITCALISLSTPLHAQQQPSVETVKTTVNADQNTFEMIKRKARILSEQKFKQPESELPDQLLDMTYSQYRNIRFDSQHSIWRNKHKFELQLFHPGFLYKAPIGLQLVDKHAGNDTVSFSPDSFIYENDAIPLKGTAKANAGFAGFRVHYPLNTEDYKDELAVFLGASYFRIVGPKQVYGISARGLAINTAHAQGEEFPFFSRFWVLEPEANPDKLVIFALLESQSVTGAYRFELSAGLDTQVDINSIIFARKDVDKLGIAPLTSMFLKSETSTRSYDDFRPEIHDSDGLVMLTSSGEKIWRQLNNPKHLQVTSMQGKQPRGFGLLQRDTDFSHYLDTEANYHKRPGLWVEPTNSWGDGRLELVEIPTPSETHDNIVAYWVPDVPFRKGQSREFNYRLTTIDGALNTSDLGIVIRSMNSWAALPGDNAGPEKRVRNIVVDFAAPKLTALDSSLPVKANLHVSGGQYDELIVRKLPDEKSWRVSFKLTADTDRAADMRLFITLRGKPISEVWNYVWSQDEIE